MEIINDHQLGGALNPVTNNYQLRQAITGRKNCIIYTKETFKIDLDNLESIRIRNIRLEGLAFAYLLKEVEKSVLKGTSDITPKGLLSELNKNEVHYGNIR